jgi:hypothetical protein
MRHCQTIAVLRPWSGPASMERSCAGLLYRLEAYTHANRNRIPVSTTSKNVLHQSVLESRSQRVRHSGLVPRLIDEHADTNHDFTSIDMIDTMAMDGSPCEYGLNQAMCNFRMHDWMGKYKIQVRWSSSNRFRVRGTSFERGQRTFVRRVWGINKAKQPYMQYRSFHSTTYTMPSNPSSHPPSSSDTSLPPLDT